MILYPSIHVCYNSGEVIYCVCASSGSFRAVRPGLIHVIGVELTGVSARCVRGRLTMIRRLRHGTRADTGDATTTTHEGHDDQSETDSQSQFSEETNTAPQVLSSKRKAPVCTDKDWQRSTSKLLR